MLIGHLTDETAVITGRNVQKPEGAKEELERLCGAGEANKTFGRIDALISGAQASAPA